MISFLIAGSIGLLALQSGIDLPRKNFGACLSSALDSAMAQKIAAAEYGAFVVKSCEAQANSLKSGLIGFDVKNGIARTRASADAQAQIDDYMAMAAERYEARVGKPKVAAAPAAAPVIPAPAPKP